jgi:hypothetical protein
MKFHCNDRFAMIDTNIYKLVPILRVRGMGSTVALKTRASDTLYIYPRPHENQDFMEIQSRSVSGGFLHLVPCHMMT